MLLFILACVGNIFVAAGKENAALLLLGGCCSCAACVLYVVFAIMFMNNSVNDWVGKKVGKNRTSNSKKKQSAS